MPVENRPSMTAVIFLCILDWVAALAYLGIVGFIGYLIFDTNIGLAIIVSAAMIQISIRSKNTEDSLQRFLKGTRE